MMMVSLVSADNFVSRTKRLLRSVKLFKVAVFFLKIKLSRRVLSYFTYVFSFVEHFSFFFHKHLGYHFSCSFLKFCTSLLNVLGKIEVFRLI